MSTTVSTAHPDSESHGRHSVPLPECPPGGANRVDIEAALAAWMESPPMRTLVAASQWSWPRGDVRAVAAELARRSEVWDFRGGRERHGLADRDGDLERLGLSEDLVVSAANGLGLIGASTRAHAYTHVVVLGGMVKACRNRAREADRLRREHGISHIAVLTARRPLAGDEPADARALGWGELALESEAAEAAAREVFELVGDPSRTTEAPRDHGAARPLDDVGAERERRTRWLDRVWRSPDAEVELVVAPSGEPTQRRANTADQLSFWAALADIEPSDNLLLVTTEHYVPFQHFEAIRVLGLTRRCGITTTGTPWAPIGLHRSTGYLQEIRSALLAAVRLLGAIESMPSEA